MDKLAALIDAAIEKRAQECAVQIIIELNERQKRAAMASELLGALTTGAVGNPIGALTALFRGRPSLLEYLARNAKSGSNFLPGVGAHRLIMRAKGEPNLIKALTSLSKGELASALKKLT